MRNVSKNILNAFNSNKWDPAIVYIHSLARNTISKLPCEEAAVGQNAKAKVTANGGKITHKHAPTALQMITQKLQPNDSF